jgi:hypothetical protein
VSWLLLTEVVGRSLLFHSTTELDTKFEPSTVKVKPGPPAVVLVGERLVIVRVATRGSVDAPEPQPQMLAPIATAISTPMSTDLRRPLVLMTPS